jgi:hypothetical protein
MTKSLVPALGLVVALVGCGELEYRVETYERVNLERGDGPWIVIGSERTRTSKGIFSERVEHKAPYSLSFGQQYEDAKTEPFVVHAVRVTHDGARVFVHAATEPPLTAAPRDGTNPDKPAMVLRVPLPELKFVEGSEVVVEADVTLPGASAPAHMREAFAPKRTVETYAGCDRFAMY